MTAPTNEELAERLRDIAEIPRGAMTSFDRDALRAAAARLSESGGAVPATGTHDALSSSTTTWLSSDPPTPPEAREVLPVDWPECREFYDLMQAYRHAPVTDQTRTSVAYENVKTYLRRQAAALIEGLSKDAERYRWLRSANKIMPGVPEKHPIEWYCGTDLDAAIDAALKERT